MAGQRDRSQQIGSVSALRHDSPIGDGVGLRPVDVETALVADLACGHDSADDVRVQRIGAEADGIGDLIAALLPDMVLGDNCLADHPPGFPHIELVGPVAVVGEFIGGEAANAQMGADGFRSAGVVLQSPDQPLLVAAVVGDDPSAQGIVGVAVVPMACRREVPPR